MSGGQVYGEPYACVPESVLYADVSTNAKVLFAIFALHADLDGRCYPGLKRLAEIMRCSEDTVKRAKKDLAEAKLIECHERYDDHGRRTTDNVFLRGAPRNAAPYVGGKDAPTELEPERSNPTPNGVGSGVTSAAPRKKTPPTRPTPIDQLPAEAREALDRLTAPMTDDERTAGQAGIKSVRETLGWNKPK